MPFEHLDFYALTPHSLRQEVSLALLEGNAHPLFVRVELFLAKKFGISRRDGKAFKNGKEGWFTSAYLGRNIVDKERV